MIGHVAGKLTVFLREKLKTYNFSKWCSDAAKRKTFCEQCGWPIDPLPEGFGTPTRCAVCESMESVMRNRSYWVSLEANEKAHRRSMGLDDGAGV